MTVLAHLPPVHRCQHADDADRCPQLVFGARTRCNQHSGEPVQRHVLEPREVRAMRRKRKRKESAAVPVLADRSDAAATAGARAVTPRSPALNGAHGGDADAKAADARSVQSTAAGRVIPAHLRLALTLAVLIALGYLLAAVTSGERSGAW